MDVSVHVSGDSALFFSFPLLSSLGWGPIESAAVPRNQNAVVWLIAAGIASFPFLPFKHLLTTTAKPDRAAGFLPAERPRPCETYRGFVFPHITCLQEI